MGKISSDCDVLLRMAGLCIVLLTGGIPLAGQVKAPSPDYWHTDGKRILDSDGKPVRIAGVNWFGMESATFAPHGLWKRSYREMLDQIKGLGFNMVRLPFSNQLFETGSRPNGIDFSRNPDLENLSGLEILDRIVAHAGRIGLRILLDRHRPDAEGQSPLWYTSSYNEDRWIADWKMLAARYKGDATVVAVDLHNEPRNPACWGCGEVSLDWRLAAQRAGNAILAENPNLLIVVEGVELYKNDSYWWGGNLKGVADAPVLLSVPNRLVYSAHDYPSSIHPQRWFTAPDYPANLPSVWDAYWGYIARTEVAPVLMGEFGSKLQTDSDVKWFAALCDYLKSSETHWLFWSWNPNSQDTNGLLLEDWTSVDEQKYKRLKAIMTPGDDTDGEVGGSAPTPTPEAPAQPEPAAPKPTTPTGETLFCTASFRIFSDWGSGFVADLHVTNIGAGPIDGWTVTWNVPGTHKVRDMWNARFNQIDQNVTAQDAGWNARIPESTSAYFGFNVDYTGQAGRVSDVALNGYPCLLEQ